MDRTLRLLAEIAAVRGALLAQVEALDLAVAHRRSSEGAWSVSEIVEHLVLAEEYGIRGLWDAATREAADRMPPPSPEFARRSIDEIMALAPERVEAPTAVVPQNGGRPLGFWLARLRSHEQVLRELTQAMEAVGLEHIGLSHHVAGPLNGVQRLQFFRWHLQRHLKQIQRSLNAAATA